MKRQLVQIIASTLSAYHNCIKAGNTEWRDKHEDFLGKCADRLLPSGSGFDNGTKIDFEQSTGEKLVLYTSYHHMDEMGGYAGWTEHKVIVTPSLVSGFNLRITGPDRNQIKDYIGQSFEMDLSTEHEEKDLHAIFYPVEKPL